jgi:hypothetical protein
MYVYRKFLDITFNPEGIICIFHVLLHTILSGLGENLIRVIYKHIFPSGIVREFVKNTLPIFTILKGLNMNNRRCNLR